MSTDNKQSLPAITLAAIGVVYGDIGTSPLYTLRECLSGQFGFGVERDAVFGFLSLIFWLLIFVVSIKYLTFVMRADNAGEGGILTLMSLAGRNTSARTTSMLVIMGLIGGSFFYGEVVITPAISEADIHPRTVFHRRHGVAVINIHINAGTAHQVEIRRQV